MDSSCPLSAVVETTAPLDASYTLPTRAGGVLFGAAVPGVHVRPTSAPERQQLDASQEATRSAAQVWSSMPDMDYAKTMQTMAEARSLHNVSAGHASDDDGWRASPERRTASRASSAASTSRLSAACTQSRPGSGPSRTAARQHSAQTSGQASLLAAGAQQTLASALELEVTPSAATDVEASGGGSALHRGPASLAFLHSLRSGSAVIRVHPERSTRAARHSAERRRLTTAPVSLLRGFEQRVRCTTPYQPVSTPVFPLVTQPQMDAAASTDAADAMLAATPSHGVSPPPTRSTVNNDTTSGGGGGLRTPLAVISTGRPGSPVAQPRAQSTALHPSMPFHTRGEYTSNLVDDTLQDLGYYSFERQKVLDIHEKGMLVKEAVVHSKMEREMMSDLRHDTMQTSISFWRAHRPPNVVDLARLLPGRGSNTRDVNVMVGKLVDCCEHPGPRKAVRMVEGLGDDPTVGRSPLWSKKERDRFYRFMGRTPPSEPLPTSAGTGSSKQKNSAIAAVVGHERPSAIHTGKPPMGRRQ